MDANHEIIIPNKGLPFKMFIFEGKNGNYVRNKHWHTSIEIFAVFKGSVRFFLNDEEYYLKEGEFVIVNSNEVHSIFAPDLNLTLVIQIPLVVFEEYYIEKNFITFSHDSNYCDKDMMGIMKEMYRAYVAKKCGYEFLTQTKFYHLLYLMVTVYRITDVSDERIKSYKHLNRLTDITNYIKEIMREISLLKVWQKYLDILRPICRRCFKSMRKLVIGNTCRVLDWRELALNL